MQHATYLKDLSLKKQAEDDAQILVWANELKEKLYFRCEEVAKLGRMYVFISDLGYFLPKGLVTSKIVTVFQKTQSMFISLGYKFDINHGVSFTPATISSIKITWEDSK
jgi:hypothetical protein